MASQSRDLKLVIVASTLGFIPYLETGALGIDFFDLFDKSVKVQLLNLKMPNVPLSKLKSLNRKFRQSLKKISI